LLQLLGYIFNSFLYGIELLQFCTSSPVVSPILCELTRIPDRYYVSFPNDRAFTRRLVYVVVLLDTLQTGFTIHDAWTLLGAGWGNDTLLTQRNWTFGSVPFFTGIGKYQIRRIPDQPSSSISNTVLVAFLVQGFYAYRVYKLVETRYTKWLVALIIFIAIGQCLCGVFAGISYVFEARVIDKRILAWVTTVWLGGTALCDLVITTTIVTFVSRPT
jgi:hypothetical protein